MRRRPRAAAGAALVGCLLLAACAAPRPAPPAVGERQAYERALALLDADPSAGQAALESFVDAYPRSGLADDAALELARLAAAAGQPDRAEAWLRQLIQRQPAGDRSDEARLALGELLREQGRLDAAYRVAAALRLSRLTPALRERAHRFLADLAGDRGEQAAQLRWMGLVRADQPGARRAAEVDAEIDALVGSLSDDALERLAGALGARIPAARLRLEQAERARRAGSAEALARALDAARALPLSPPDVDHLRALERSAAGRLAGLPAAGGGAPLPDPTGARGTLGVVLPLTGSYASFGEQSLQGIALALGLFDAGAPRPSGLRLLVRDSAGDPERAAAAVRELAGERDVSAVVGPLLGGAAEAAAGVAQDRHLPLLALTRRERVAERGPFVLRLGGSPRTEVERVADYAIRSLGARRFALLYPEDGYGRTLRAAFWDAVEARGGVVVGVARYEPGATDFAEPIRRLLGYPLLGAEEREQLAERERLRKRARRLPPEQAAELRRTAWEMTAPDGAPLPPQVDFDALFVPDAHETAALIAAHLAFQEVRGVRLLGLSGWNHPDLLEIGGRHVDGAVFAAGYFAGSQRPAATDFTRRFRQAFDAEPGYLAAQAHDAAALWLRGVQAEPGDRRDLLETLLQTPPMEGATGALRLGADGSVLRRPQLLGVEHGRIISIDESGAAPELPPAPLHPWEETADGSASPAAPARP